MDETLREVIKTSLVVARRGRYAYLRALSVPAGGYFMIARDADETTVVCEEAGVPEVAHSRREGWFKLLEIRVSQPFAAKGFLAAVCAAVAGRDLNILVVSTFSKDYILVREEAAREAADALVKTGFPMEWEE
ncbi:MAG: ACT domain-containing protein [Planctomycetota bacterium]|jgi:hypothetical protein|nr:ACT domain-containing protein [Planctomycetota bacterium]